jgi:hypothetical protein
MTARWYSFDMGNSNVGPIGFCATVRADSPEDAAKVLNAELPEMVEVNVDHGDVDLVSVYFNPSVAVSAADAILLPCDACDGSGVFRDAPNDVERCDSCEVFESDAAAAVWLAAQPDKTPVTAPAEPG